MRAVSPDYNRLWVRVKYSVIYVLIEIQSISCKRRLKLPVYQQQVYLSLTVFTLEKNLGTLFSKPLNRETN